jgi:hypothetical protein
MFVLSFCYYVLLGCILTRSLILYPLRWQVFSKCSIGILYPIIIPQYFHNYTVLSLNHFVKIFEASNHITFIFHQVKPSHTRKIINERDKISNFIQSSCKTRSSYIKINQIKQTRTPITRAYIRDLGILV